MMVAVGLAGGCDVGELGPGPRVGETADETIGQVFAFRQQALEGNRTGNGAIVKEEVQYSARGQAQPVGHCRVDTPATDASPATAADLAHPAGLVGCEN